MLLGSKKAVLIIALIFAYIFSVAQNNCEELAERLKAGNLIGIESLINDSSPCSNTIGQIYLRKGMNDKAEEAFQKYLSESNNKPLNKAEALNALGIVYWNGGSTEKAKQHIEQSLAIRQKEAGENHESTAASYNDLGLVLSATEPELALDYYESALKIYKKIYGEKNEKTAQSLINTGIAYQGLEFYGDASLNLSDALKIWKELYPNGHPNEGFILINIGQNKQKLDDWEGALKAYTDALAIYKKFYGEEHPEVASTLNLIGNLYNIKGEFNDALNYYQKALIANTKKFKSTDIENNPSVTDYYNSNTLLNSLYYKSKAEADLHFNKTLKFSDLKMSLSTLQSCDTLIDKIRQVRTNEADKLALGQLSSAIYETGVELCKAMGDVAVKKDDFYELSFYFAEKSKSAVLLEAIADAKAKSFAGLSDEDLEQESFLKTEIAYLEKSVLQEENIDMKAQLQSSLLSSLNDYSKFVSEIEKKYPKYYALKYNSSLPTVKDVQAKLEENETVLSYFLTENSKRVYIFEITKNDFELHSNPQTEEFDKYISGFRNSIYFGVKPTYELTATNLYNIIIPKKLDKNTTDLIIIPAGRLGTIPFEALLTAKVKGDVAYKDLPYLINSYNISYSYASALFVESKEAPSIMENKAFLCAPVTFTDLPSLPGSKEEVDKLNSILANMGFGADNLLEANANESEIKSQDFRKYKYVHLATHGVVNESNPALSRIFFNPSTLEDGNLYTGEIYNLQFDTDLVTLSACETGLGKLSKGEGVIGLSRALLYAGANNLVVSLWTVSDASTAQLMTQFYSNFNSSKYAPALSTAKKKLISSDDYSAPFYWAPFILIGE